MIISEVYINRADTSSAVEVNERGEPRRKLMSCSESVA